MGDMPRPRHQIHTGQMKIRATNLHRPSRFRISDPCPITLIFNVTKSLNRRILVWGFGISSFSPHLFPPLIHQPLFKPTLSLSTTITMTPTTTTVTLAAGVTTTGTTLCSNYSLSRRLSNLHFQLTQSSRLGCANYKFHLGAKPIYFTLSLPPRVTNRVTSVPVDDVDTPVPEFDPRGEIVRLKALRSRLQNVNSLQEKIRVLDSDSRVRMLFGKGRGGGGVFPTKILVGLGMWEMFLVKCLVAAGQGHVVGLEMEVEDEGGEGESSGLKTAFRVMAGMVEKWGLNGEVNGIGLEREGERGDLKELLRILGEVEQFYDCIGGIIGKVLGKQFKLDVPSNLVANLVGESLHLSSASTI